MQHRFRIEESFSNIPLEYISEADSEWGAGGARPSFCCNHFEELQTSFVEVELIINNINICLPKYYRNMFNTQSFVISQTIIIFF